MPRPRFHKLPPEQQEALLRVALDEFARHGYSGASLNKIIELAGISKGSLYYYFDDKADLYAHVARVELGRLFRSLGPLPLPSVVDAERFWSTLEAYYLRCMSSLAASPKLAALLRDWLAASANPALQEAQREMEQAVLPAFEAALVAGQRARAIRDDLPLSLLIAVVFGMGQAMDVWLLNQQLDDEGLREMVRVFVDMMKKALAPRAPAG